MRVGLAWAVLLGILLFRVVGCDRDLTPDYRRVTVVLVEESRGRSTTVVEGPEGRRYRLLGVAGEVGDEFMYNVQNGGEL